MNTESIINMARGSVIKRIDAEMEKVIANINDPTTEPTRKRSITIKVELKPSDDRMKIDVAYTVSSHLEPAVPIVTSVFNGIDNSTGELYLVENTPNLFGQMSLTGKEQEAPNVLKFAAPAD